MYFKCPAINMSRFTTLSIKGFEIALHRIYKNYFDVFTNASPCAMIRDFFLIW